MWCWNRSIPEFSKLYLVRQWVNRAISVPMLVGVTYTSSQQCLETQYLCITQHYTIFCPFPIGYNWQTAFSGGLQWPHFECCFRLQIFKNKPHNVAKWHWYISQYAYRITWLNVHNVPLTIPVWKPAYPGWTRQIPYLLMTWPLP